MSFAGSWSWPTSRGATWSAWYAKFQTGVTEKVLPTLSAGYFVEYGGQFEAQQEANLRLLIMGFVAVTGVFLLLLKCLGSWRARCK